MRRLTCYTGRKGYCLLSKPPMRRLTFDVFWSANQFISKPPMRRLTAGTFCYSWYKFSKPPMRRLTAIISPRCLISCHLAPIILPFTFFLGNHKIPYYNCIHNIWKKIGKSPINICFCMQIYIIPRALPHENLTLTISFVIQLIQSPLVRIKIPTIVIIIDNKIQHPILHAYALQLHVHITIHVIPQIFIQAMIQCVLVISY